MIIGMGVKTFSYGPKADFKWSPTMPTDLEKVHFIDNSTGDIVAWIWYFGDGDSSTKQNPYHKYADNGTYNVRLVIWTSNGIMEIASKNITIANVPPYAIIGDKRIFNSRTVNLSSKSYDLDGYVTAWYWSLGDGSHWSGKNITHTYTSDGIYLINLTVYDNDNAFNKTNTTIMVDTIPPVTNYNVSCLKWCNENVSIKFNATDNLSGVNYTMYKIDDGDWNKYNKTIIISSEGKHKIYFYSVDIAGNIENEKNVSIKIDKTKPSIKLNSPKQGYIYIGGREIIPTIFGRTFIIGKFSAEAEANDKISGIAYVEFVLNGKILWKDYVSPYNAELPQEFPISFSNGLKTIAYDNAGNYKESNEVTYIKIL